MDATATIVVAIVSSGAFTAIVNAIITAIHNRKSKKSGVLNRLDNIESKVDKLTEHNELQYLSLLRLTVMDTDMPMSERLIAGKEYLSKGGNGDVKAFYIELENNVNKGA